ncbi:GNAT family N-acetyltransferase [Chromobacterium sp. CV08]|uniref:GNAT family N-acetyltransferase n=1 Tax=Chromobacterium sp. CV08 TaxID=3133274 RepID=UPI003DA847FB
MSAIALEPAVMLRGPRLDDAETLFSLVDASRATLRQWLPWVDGTVGVDDSRRFLAGVVDGARDGSACATWLIEVDGGMAGCIDIHGISRLNRSGYLGYWLADAHVGKGVMRRAVAQALDIGFGELELNRLCIDAAVDNVRSCRVAERLGFRREGVLREYLRLHGRYHDACQYSMLAREWTPRR